MKRRFSCREISLIDQMIQTIGRAARNAEGQVIMSVSYTHLTLPTT